MRLTLICAVSALTLVVSCFLAVAADEVPPGAAAAKPPDPGAPGLVLDGTGHFRRHIEFGLMKLNGDLLRRDGEKLFGERIRRLEGEVKKLLAHRNIDWEKTDWRDAACWVFISAQVGDDRGALARLPMVRPPADWTNADFDDSGFDRLRVGLAPWRTIGWIAYQQSTLYLRGYYLRTYFDVPDPTKATDLTVKVVYRGGARVFVNGQEIGRGHLPALSKVEGPAGETTSETFAADYPSEAYTATKDELPPRPEWGEFVGDIRCRFDQAPGLVGILAEVAPDLGWAAGSHGRVPDQTFRACGRAYGVELQPESTCGWKNPFIHLLITRYAGSIICVEGGSTPFTYRVMCDRAIHCGFNGLGRIGADYFNHTWFDGCRANQYNIAGRAIVQTLWPGKTGVESSARNEAMLEGIQEAEARTFLEQALDRKAIKDDLAAEVKGVLDGHFLSTAHICAGAQDVGAMDITNDWRSRSRRLYAAAAKVAAAVGLDVDRTTFGKRNVPPGTTMTAIAGGEERKYTTGTEISLPALGRKELSLTLRNWTDKPRRWTAAADQPWIVPAAREGTVTGQQALGFVLDGGSLKPGEEVSGTLTITDAATGTAYPVRIAAKVAKGIDFRVVQEVRFVTGGGSGSDQPHEVIVRTSPVFNVPAGGSEAQEYFLANHTAARQEWKIASSHDWLAAEPSGGQLEPGASLAVRVVARPKADAAYDNSAVLTLTAAGGAVKEEYPIRVFVIPAYTAPAVPAGQTVWLRDLDRAKYVKRCVDYGFVVGDTSKDRMQRPWWVGGPGHNRTSRPCGENIRATVFNYKSTPEQEETHPFKIAGKEFTRGMWVVPHFEAVYNVEGAGFSAFATEVGFYDKYGDSRMANLGAHVVFEIHVDGQVRAVSGIVKVGDKPRLLVVTGLEKAKELRLVTRRHDLGNDEACLGTWADARFIK